MTSRSRAAADQLVLALDEQSAAPMTDIPGPGRSTAMLPGHGTQPFDDEGWFFEPWWPGVLATIVIDDGRVTLMAGQLADPLETARPAGFPGRRCMRSDHLQRLQFLD